MCFVVIAEHLLAVRKWPDDRYWTGDLEGFAQKQVYRHCSITSMLYELNDFVVLFCCMIVACVTFLVTPLIITRSSAIAVIADRTACIILTLFIVTATSRRLNKKIRLLSVRGSNNYCGSASAIRSPHTSVCTCCRRQGLCYAINSTGLGRRSHGRTVWPFNGTLSLLTNEPTWVP